MNEKRVLLAEDELVSATYLKDSLSALGYKVTLANDGKQALEYYLENPFPVVITDYEMPGLNGAELIQELKSEEIEPVIFMLTSHINPKLIVNVMKLGIYDYLVKPLEEQEISIKLKRAFEFYEMKRIETITKRERQLRLEGHLEWIQWKEKMAGVGEFNRLNQNLFESLKNSFCQGAGFGALVTLLKLVSDTTVKEGNHYKIESDLMELIQINTEMAEKALKMFADIDLMVSSPIQFAEISCAEFYDQIQYWLQELKPLLDLKGQQILISDLKPNHTKYKISYNSMFMQNAFKEIITNACKFSESNSKITIVTNVEHDWFKCAVYNQPVLNADGTCGIPLQYENLIFEPFYRLSKNVYDEYGTLDFGLGLSYVDSCFKKHNGKLSVHNVVDHSEWSENPITKVAFQFSLPVNKI
ncbi:response regulator [Leptospira montravelensis]|uniref:Response regulator n=1 Tax=Leptospira montravelensis TaxID=2484961 RepID=A0ABY2LV94_9LEPT|nr:response regulator [Leptospira montravelensis]TGK78135.1 response regulator [Leptospira montravelensis]TGL03818.1 response regulator [Leptospira montravelensis]